jgi:inhibitor of KinA
MNARGELLHMPELADGWTLSRAGDAALVLECEQRIDPHINARVIAVAQSIRNRERSGVRDVVESYCAITVHFDPLKTDMDSLVQDLPDDTRGKTQAVSDSPGPRRHSVPVCYGGEYGPDLDALASFAKCDVAKVIETHSAVTYRVYMLGFVPGFAYMATVPSQLAMPRRSTPRLEVPQGSVGIAGRQTGVYSLAAPGGWQVIGRTPVIPFELGRSEPFLFRPGDEVCFEPIGQREFEDTVEQARG